LGLHAWALAFIHPITQKSLRFESLVPKKFAQLFAESTSTEKH